MNDEVGKLLKVVGELYESVLDETRWLPAMQSIHGLLGGHAAFHIIADPQTGAVALSEQVGVDPVANELYLEYYAQKEVRIPPALVYGVGEVVTERRLLDRKAYEGSEIYRDLLLPYDIPHIMAVWLQRTSHACQALVVEAGHRHGPFEHQALETFSALVPHLIRAARMREAFVAARRERDIRMDVLDRLPFGIIFLDGTGSAVGVTAEAERLLQKGDGLRVHRSRVSAQFPDDDRRLQEATFHSTRGRGNGSPAGATLAIRRRPPKPALHVVVIPIAPSPVLTVTPLPAAMLVVTDPGRAPQAHPDAIREALRLTQAESLLAAILFTGASLREAAESLGKSFHTCKTQLKSIYAKTGCRNHVELTKALALTAIAQGAASSDR
jgi:DNA-binding CsgD family transcriptional regulator